MTVESIFKRALHDPEGAYKELLAQDSDIAALESSHDVVSNRYRAGVCDICLAPISWLGPELRLTPGGRWVHGPLPPYTRERQRTRQSEATPLRLFGGGCDTARMPVLIAAVSDRTIDLPEVALVCEGRLHRHHRIPRQDGGSDAASNLVTLCEKHHKLVHRVMAIYGRASLE